MKIYNKKQKHLSRKKLSLLVGLIFVVICLTGFLAYSANIFGIRGKEDATLSKSDNKNVDSAIESSGKSTTESADSVTPNDISSDSKTTPQNTDTPTAPKSDASGKYTVTMSLSVSDSGQSVFLRGGIDNAVVSEGECYAMLTSPSGQTSRKNTTLLQNPSTTDCKTIEIKKSELTQGTWSVTLHYVSSTSEGVSSVHTVEIK